VAGRAVRRRGRPADLGRRRQRPAQPRPPLPAQHAGRACLGRCYVDALRAAQVVVDPEVRREIVRGELARLEHETGLRVRPDEALLGEVIHLGEHPVGVSGGFDASFLEVPEEIIVTAMRTHQRYFAMEHRDGRTPASSPTGSPR